MSSRQLSQFLAGNTIQFTWVSSTVTLENNYAAVFNDQETLVSSATMTSSGNGHYYANYTCAVGSDGYYVAELGGDVLSLPRRTRLRFKVSVTEV
jgi:hypothetical protein